MTEESLSMISYRTACSSSNGPSELENPVGDRGVMTAESSASAVEEVESTSTLPSQPLLPDVYEESDLAQGSTPPHVSSALTVSVRQLDTVL